MSFRVMIMAVFVALVSGTALAQGKSSASHGGGAPASTPAPAPSAPAAAPALSSSAAPATPSGGGTTAGSIPTTGSIDATRSALPPLPTASGLPSGPLTTPLTPTLPGAAGDCIGKSDRTDTGASEARKCQ